MTSIDLPEDHVPSLRLTFGQTLLRITLGSILVAHGARRFLALEQWQDELAARFALLEPGVVAHALIAAELLGGVSLIFGWLTRFGAFALLCSGVGSIALEFLRQNGVLNQAPFELPVLLAIGALFLLLAGGGRASLDVALRARARRKAIENDDIWLKHPYVAPSDELDEDMNYVTHPLRRVAERR